VVGWSGGRDCKNHKGEGRLSRSGSFTGSKGVFKRGRNPKKGERREGNRFSNPRIERGGGQLLGTDLLVPLANEQGRGERYSGQSTIVVQEGVVTISGVKAHKPSEIGTAITRPTDLAI